MEMLQTILVVVLLAIWLLFSVVFLITAIQDLVNDHKPYLKALQENTGDASLLNIQQLEMLLEQNTEQ